MELVVLSPSQVAAEEAEVHNPGVGEVGEGPEFQLLEVAGEGVVWVAPCLEEGVVAEEEGVGLHQVEGAGQGEVEEGGNDPYLGGEGVEVGVEEGQVLNQMN